MLKYHDIDEDGKMTPIKEPFGVYVMKINEKPREIKRKAEKECLEMYPIGTRLYVQLRDNWSVMYCKITQQCGCSEYKIKDLDTGKTHNFYPGCHPHRVL